MTIQDLKKLSVYELRMLARAMGVRAPTAKSCEQMIAEILAIENGELEPFKSKKGRPPKSKGSNFEMLRQSVGATSLVHLGYEPIKRVVNYGFCSDDLKNSNITYKFKGVVREFNGTYYIQDYLHSIEFAVLPEAFHDEVECGDIIVGNAVDFESNFKQVKTFEKIQFINGENNYKDKVVVMSFNSNDDMRNFAENQCGNNIILEIETSKFLGKGQEPNNLFLHSKRCDDILTTYNVLLDAKNCVKQLCDNKEKFTLYMTDIEYIYYTLSLYFQYRNVAADINAGQYFKEIFTAIDENENANVVIMHKENETKSSYLELIVNRYLK